MFCKKPLFRYCPARNDISDFTIAPESKLLHFVLKAIEAKYIGDFDCNTYAAQQIMFLFGVETSEY